MTINDNVIVSRERPFFAHHIFLGAAKVALENAEKKEPGWFYYELMAMTMSTLAIEALCNAVGERVIDNWMDDFEKLPPNEKVKDICKNLNIEYYCNTEPWSTVVWLSGLRNKLAHAKPQQLNETYNLTRNEYEKNISLIPESKLESQITLGNAKRAYREITKLKYIFGKNIPIDQSFGILADSWSGRSSS